MIGLDQCGRVYMVSCFPCVVCIGVSFPFDEVLELSSTAKVTVINDGLDLIFFGIFIRKIPKKLAST